jgi:hypothetical protein
MSKVGFVRNLVPTTLILPDGRTTTSAKETVKTLLQKFFPGDFPSRDGAQQKNIRNQVADTKPPDTQAVPDIMPQEMDEVIGKLYDKNAPDRTGLTNP